MKKDEENLQLVWWRAFVLQAEGYVALPNFEDLEKHLLNDDATDIDIIYLSPADALAMKLQTLVDPVLALKAWADSCTALIKLHRQHRRKMRLIEAGSALDLGLPPNAVSPDNQAVANGLAKIAALFLAIDTNTKTLMMDLQASTTGAFDLGPDATILRDTVMCIMAERDACRVQAEAAEARILSEQDLATRYLKDYDQLLKILTNQISDLEAALRKCDKKSRGLEKNNAEQLNREVSILYQTVSDMQSERDAMRIGKADSEEKLRRSERLYGDLVERCEVLSAEVTSVKKRLTDTEAERVDLAAEMEAFLNSNSWRITAPLRWVIRKLR
jgi:hypothetical protein